MTLSPTRVGHEGQEGQIMWLKASEKMEADKKPDYDYEINKLSCHSCLFFGSFPKLLYHLYGLTIWYISFSMNAKGNVYFLFSISKFFKL